MRHFVLVTARGLGRRTLKTITHHSQEHTERSVYQVRALSPAKLVLLKTQKKLSYCWETVRRESMPRIAEIDEEMTT